MEKKNNKLKIFLNGIYEENPVLILMIGLCPLLAVSSSIMDAFGMGIAASIVLLCSNITISLVRKVIPEQIRIPVFIIIISTFVTIIDYLMAAYLPPLHRSLGVFVPLIVVNCVILGRGEAFAYRNSVLDSIVDALGMGIGFTIVITIIGFMRELFGNGTLFGTVKVFNEPALIMILPPGAFIAIGILMGLQNWLKNRGKRKALSDK